MTEVIAEAANNHLGDVSLAKEMIHAAHECGADWIKFQSWQAKNINTKNPRYRDMYEMMSPKELSDADHWELLAECHKVGIKFLTTCFDCARIEFLKSLGINTVKVASTEIINDRLLANLANIFERIIISTGGASDGEIKHALCRLRDGASTTLMHCVSDYPTSVVHVNLKRMLWLNRLSTNIRNDETINVGYSDHTIGTDVAKMAICMGARYVEKHFTLKKDTDNKFSCICADTSELEELTHFRGAFEFAKGIEQPPITAGEQATMVRYRGLWDGA